MTDATSSPGGHCAAHDLADVDVLRERLDASYSEAKEALDATDGDLISALAYIEEQRGQASSTLASLVQEVVEEVRTVASDGQVTAAKVTLRGQPVFTAPLALAGAAGAALVILGAILSNCRVEVAVGEREDSEE